MARSVQAQWRSGMTRHHRIRQYLRVSCAIQRREDVLDVAGVDARQALDIAEKVGSLQTIDAAIVVEAPAGPVLRAPPRMCRPLNSAATSSHLSGTFAPNLRAALEVASLQLAGKNISLESDACGRPRRRAYRRCWRRGRVAEGGGLLNRYRVVKPYRGFESLRLRHLRGLSI